jgi:hypothetical protein
MKYQYLNRKEKGCSSMRTKQACRLIIIVIGIM